MSPVTAYLLGLLTPVAVVLVLALLAWIMNGVREFKACFDPSGRPKHAWYWEHECEVLLDDDDEDGPWVRVSHHHQLPAGYVPEPIARWWFRRYGARRCYATGRSRPRQPRTDAPVIGEG